MSLLIVGCGYVGQELVRQLRSDPKTTAQPIFALTRSTQRAAELHSIGIQTLFGNWLDGPSLPTIPAVSKILVAVPHREDTPDGSSENGANDQLHAKGLENLYHWLTGSGTDIGRSMLIYLSTTGVFGTVEQGEWIDERSAISPTRPGPKIAASAERWLAEHRSLWPSTVLRLAGIYGPGRVPLIGQLQAGNPLAVPRDGYLNLIHVTDIARAIIWLLEHPASDSLYLLSDGQPVLRENFYRYLAELCSVAQPQFIQPDPDSSKVRRATDKRIDSSRFWNQSGLTPIYSDYRAALRAIMECQF